MKQFNQHGYFKGAFLSKFAPFLLMLVWAAAPLAARAVTTNTINFYNTTAGASGTVVGPVNPANGPTTISGTGLNVGDLVVFDGVVVDVPGSGSDAWGAVNLNSGGYGGVVNATLGVLLETGTSSGNPCQLFLNGTGNSTKFGTSQGYQTIRLHVVLTCTAAGSTANMNYLVQIDQGNTGTYSGSLSGSGVTFANNTIGLSFGANNEPHNFTPVQSSIIAAAATPPNLVVAAGVNATFTTGILTNLGFNPLQFSEYWLSNGVPIPGATGMNYTLPAASTAENGAQFNFVISNLVVPGNVVTSAPSILTVRSVPGLVPFIFSPTNIANTSVINPLSPPCVIPGTSLLAGDTVVFDAIIATNGPLTGTGDGWIAINLQGGGYQGVTTAELGLLVRLGAGTGQLYVYGGGPVSPNPTSVGALKNRARIELYPSVTGSTTNMGWLVKVDQNLTGNFLTAVTGTNLTFANNQIPLSFGSYSVAGLITPLPVGLQAIQDQLSSTNLIVGGFAQATITENFLNLSNLFLAPNTPGLSYASSDPTVVTISTSGFVSAVGAGQATITVNYSTFSTTNTVTVFPLTSLLSVSLGLNNTMTLNSTQQLSVLGNFQNVNNINLLNYGQTAFNLSNSNIVSISSNGVVTPIAPGTVTISAVNSGVTSAPQQLTVTFPTNLFVFDTFGDGFWTIANKGNANNLIINPSGASQATPINSSTNQQFEILYNLQNNSFRIRNRATWLCLGANPVAPSTKVIPVVYNASTSQQWYLLGAGNGYYRILNGASGLVLQSDNGNPANVTLTNISASTYQLWSFGYQAHYPKKGCAGYEGNYAKWGLDWAYNYDDNTAANLPPSVNYAPMTYAAQYWEPLSDVQARDGGWLTNAQPAYILAYNEPDNTGANGGSNTSTNQVIANWPQIEALNVPIVSPACATTYGAWMNNFWSMIANNQYRVDYTALHEYVPPNASSLMGTLQSVYNSYGRPIWLTEFSPVDWSNTKSWSEDDDYNFLAEFMWQAEGNDWLKRYSIFPFTGTNSAQPWVDNGYTGTMFLDTNLTLSPYGELYATWDGDLTLHARTPYIIHNLGTSFRLTATNNVVTPRASSIYVRNATTEWALLPAPVTNHWYIISLNDGRRLSNNGGTLFLATVGTTNSTVDWYINGPDGNGYYYIDNVARSQSVRGTGTAPAISFGVIGDPASSSGAAAQWRFVKPYQPPTIATVAPPSASIKYTSQSVTLNWSGNGRFYNIYRGTNSGGPYTKIVNLNTNVTYTDPSVQNGTAYYYVVTELNILGEESGYSSELAAYPAATTPQSLNFGTSSDGMSLQLNWAADHTGWRLLMNTGNLTDSTAWLTVPNSALTNLLWIPFDQTQSNVFFQLVYP
jgi:hypothetical protein